MKHSWRISGYIIRAILPYFFSSWLLLSVILFVQQATRYSDIFFNNALPGYLIWQLSIALIPNVISFTCPMAVLLGVVIGLSKMQGDSELVAIRAAGVGNGSIALPVAVFGLALTIFAFLVNIFGVPFAAQMVRRVAIQSALLKLESPIEPGVFNSEFQSYTIYVRDGDVSEGSWRNIFIYHQDKANGVVRLITAEKGRIDSVDGAGEFADNSELVLEDCSISTIPLSGSEKGAFATERIGKFRIIVKTKRSELIERFSKTEETAEELGLGDLYQFAATRTGKEQREAQLLFQRRILLSVTPLLFSLLGTGLVLRFSRGGRGTGLVLGLVGLVIYYLATLLGEQLARTGSLSTLSASMIPISMTLGATIWFFAAQRLYFSRSTLSTEVFRRYGLKVRSALQGKAGSGMWSRWILDLDIVSSLLRYFITAVSFLTAIYLLFTAFELWKFAGSMPNGIWLLSSYLGYLIPFVFLQISPSALMIATISTYVIKSRQNEVVTWTAAGQSIYRLLFPCFALMLSMGLFNFALQETILSNSNVRQDELRSQIRSRGAVQAAGGRSWFATETRIFSFEKKGSTFDDNQFKSPEIFEFVDQSGAKRLVRVLTAEKGSWSNSKLTLNGNVKENEVSGGISVGKTLPDGYEFNETKNPLRQTQSKPSHLTTAELQERATIVEAESDARTFWVAYYKRYATIFLPLVIVLFTAPFALTLSRRGKAGTVGTAVGVWLVFMGIATTFEQYGLSGQITPLVAVWGPLVWFSIVGVFLLGRVKT